MTELLPCPFCGGEPEIIHIEEEGENFGGSCIGCTDCGASSPVHFDRKENLHSSWNTRKSDYAQTPVLADPIKAALIGLNDAIDLYWNEGRTEGQVKNICYWQFKAKEALAQGPDTSTLQTNREGK